MHTVDNEPLAHRRVLALAHTADGICAHIQAAG